MAKDYSQVNFRIPTQLKERIDQVAKENEQSITAEIVERLENSFIDSIPADGITKIVGAYFMGLHSRYIAEQDELKELLKNDPNNQQIIKKIDSYDLLISEAQANLNRLIYQKNTEKIEDLIQNPDKTVDIKKHE